VWGESVQSERAENRYYHNKLGFTFQQPLGWTVSAGSKSIVARAPDGSAELSITVRRLDASSTPRSVLQKNANGDLNAGLDLDQFGLKGYTAVARSGATARRLGVVDYNNLSYLFEGKAQDFALTDGVLLSMIESFRPTLSAERRDSSGDYVHYIQVPRGATIASLAASMRIPYADAQLRLLNGLYPRGEPRIGDWVKVIQ
jgi:predicted Zn-dependent protease